VNVAAFCDPGDQILSGGYSVPRGDIVTASAPQLTAPHSWNVSVNTALAVSGVPGQSYSVFAFAICADTAP
jgi:hypothetical protein